MSTAQYLVAIDVGSTFIKGALFQSKPTGQQEMLASIVAPGMIVEQTLGQIISQFDSIIKKKSTNGEYNLVIIGHPPDVKEFKSASQISRISHEEAISAVAKRMSSTGTIVAVDIGSRRSMVALGKYGKTSVESFNYGVGVESWNFLRRGPQTEQLRSLLVHDIGIEEIENYVANKSLYPHMIPLAPSEIAIEQALVKLILKQISTELSFPWDDIQQVVLSGSVLSQTDTDTQTVSMLLDGLQPLNSFQLLSDASATLFACGGAIDFWAAQDYRAARSILNQTIAPLGTVISFAADKNDAKQRLANITLDTGLSSEQAIEVRAGEIVCVPMSMDDEGQITVKSGSRTKPANVQDQSQDIYGGKIGLIIDGRSRPLEIPKSERERRMLLSGWDKQLNVHRQIGIIGEAG